jgi:2-C-methyl-D-erythritol 4-phosphate cytidylyltransferase
MTIWAIVPAAGIGLRLGSTIPKQYLPLAGKPVVQHSLERLAALDGIDSIVVPVHRDDRWHQQLAVAGTELEFIAGGGERQQSVLNALQHISGRATDADWVLVHDAVRPCVRVADMESLLQCVASHDCGGLLGAPVVSTLKRVDSDRLVQETLDRKNCWQAYTPQVFRYGLLKQALEQAIADGVAVTDEASALEAAGYNPLMVEGDHLNIKITHESDLRLAAMILQQQEELDGSA